VADDTDQKSSEAGASEAMYRGMAALAADALISADEMQRITAFNPGAERIFGYATAEALGQPLDLLLPARFVALHREHVRAFAAGQLPLRLGEQRPRIAGRRKDGEEFPAEASISRLVVGGRCVLTVALRDLSDQVEEERVQRLLAQAGELLAESLDQAGTLRRIAELAVPGIAEGCIIWLRSGERELRPAVSWHVDPEKRALLQQITPIRPSGAEGSLRVVTTGAPRLLPELSQEHLQALAGDDEHHQRASEQAAIAEKQAAALGTDRRYLRHQRKDDAPWHGHAKRAVQ